MNTSIKRGYNKGIEVALCSIIIPVYNVRDYIVDTINSILNQTYKNWECIIIDDGCLDDTLKIILEKVGINNRFKIIKRPENRVKGPSASRNFGFEFSTGDYIQFFDGDDLMDPQHLEKKINGLKQNPDLDFIVCQSASFDNDINNITISWKDIFSDNPFEDHVCGKINFLIHGPMFRRTYLEKQDSLFNETIKYNEEWEFYSRILQSKPYYSPVNEILVYYRINPQGSTKLLYTSEKKLMELINGYYCGFKSFEKDGTITPKIRRFLIRRYIPILTKSLLLKYKKAVKTGFKHIFEIDGIYGLLEIALSPFRIMLRSFRKWIRKLQTLQSSYQHK